MSSTDEVTADERALGAERQILLDVGTSGNRAVHHDVAATVDLVGDAREHGCRPRSVGERTAAVIGDDDAGGARLNAQFGFVRRHDALEKKRKRRGTDEFLQLFEGLGFDSLALAVAALAAGEDLRTAMNRAAKASAISVTREGAATSIPRRSEVEALAV